MSSFGLPFVISFLLTTAATWVIRAAASDYRCRSLPRDPNLPPLEDTYNTHFPDLHWPSETRETERRDDE